MASQFKSSDLVSEQSCRTCLVYPLLRLLTLYIGRFLILNINNNNNNDTGSSKLIAIKERRRSEELELRGVSNAYDLP